MLATLLPVVSLQVVNDGQVVDVAAVGGDVPMLVTRVFLLELPYQLLCTRIMINKKEKMDLLAWFLVAKDVELDFE